jgi:hypothetical protein
VGYQEQPPSRLVEAQEQFQLLVAGVQDYAIFLLDPAGHVMSWNAGAERMKGYRGDEIIGKHFSVFYRPEDLRSAHPQYELDTARREGRYDEQGWRVRKDGSLFWASVVITALQDPPGTPAGFLEITRDLTKRRQGEQSLRDSEERFRLLVESVKDYAIFMLDPEGRIVSWNAGAERLKGYRAEEIIGSHFSRFYPKEDLKAGKPARELEVAIAEGRYEEEGWRVRKDGSLFWASVTITAVHDPAGALRGFAKVTRDLTRQREAAKQQIDLVREQSARAAAEKANQVKDEFLAVLSHELRTPLNAIVGWSHLLRSPGKLGPEQVARGLDAIERNALIQNQIVSDVLDISRITSGKIRLNPRRVDAREVMTAAVDTIRLAADARRTELRWEAPAEPQLVWADPDRLQQVLWNLLSNAVKFTPPGGRVEASLARTDSHIVITVSDTGVGIAPAFLPHVFESFFQADSSSTRTHGGLGLGLAIAKRLVEIHGGEVRASSEGEGRGTTLTVTLPVLPVAGLAPAAHSISPPSAFRLNGVSVLVVDDHADSRELVTTILEGLGAVVHSAGSAAEGLALLRAERPDVLVSDLEMPDQSGYEMIRQVRALPLGEGGLTPAVALTAYARSEDRIRVLAAGFQEHVAKPALPEELAAAIAAVAGWKRS